MKTIKEVLYFCYKFTFYDIYNIERVVDLHHIRECNNNVLSESDFKREGI